MNRQTLLQMWDHLRQVNGVGLRLIEAFPENKLDTTVIPGMRTPKELIVHMYGQVVREMADGATKANITNECEKNEKQIAASLKTKADVLNYARQCWNAADKSVQSMTDERLMAHTTTPWGQMAFPAFVSFNIMSDEYLHHRGQLYAYLRAVGVQPPHMWYFHENAEEFRPKATATA